MNHSGKPRCRARRPQSQRPMRPPGVVMGGVYGKYLAQVLLAEEQHPVGDLGPDGQHEAFGEAVRPRTPLAEVYDEAADLLVVQGPSGCEVTPRMCR